MVKLIKKLNKKSLKPNTNQKGGAIYTFDLNDKIGGLPAWVPLNGTKDGDCPAAPVQDLGFVNYGLAKGGSRKRSSRRHSKSKHSKKSHTRKNKTSRKNNSRRRK
jgi:hypothetical protein